MSQNAHFSALGNQSQVRLLLVLVVIISSITHGVSFMPAESLKSEADNITSERKVLEKRFLVNIVDDYHDKINEKVDDEYKAKVDEYLVRAVVRKELMTDWENIKKVPTTIFGKWINGVAIGRQETIQPSQITLKKVFHFLQFFPLLYRWEQKPVVLQIPVDGWWMVLLLKNGKSGGFTVYDVTTHAHVKDLSDITSITKEMINSFKTNNDISTHFPSLLRAMFHSELYITGRVQQFEYDYNLNVRNAFRIGVQFLVSTSILRKALPNLFELPPWLQNIHINLENARKELEDSLNNKIKIKKTTKLQYELTASMLLRSKDFEKEWKTFLTKNVVDNQPIVSGKSTLRELFKLLQSFLVYYPDNHNMYSIEVPIGGSIRIFYLEEQKYGNQQIVVKTKNSDWPSSTPRGRGNTKGSPDTFWAPDYKTILKVLDNYPDQFKLAEVMLAACKAKLYHGLDFSDELKHDQRTATQTADLIRHVVEFLVITMVAEAATPTDKTKAQYIKHMADTINKKGHFPETNEMPELAYVKPKTGRSPTMDDVVLGLLETIHNGNRFGEVFDEENFPVRIIGGTQEGREYLYYHGDDDIPSYLIQQQANGPGGTFAEKARRSCTGSK